MARLSALVCLGIMMVSTNRCTDENAWGCLTKAHHCLNNLYDYHAAITWFSRASDLYANETLTEETKQNCAQAWIGLAMSYHNVGKASLSTLYIHKAQELLGIPDNAADFTNAAQFSPAAAEYFVVKGYHFYIQFERSQRANEAIAQQEACLHQAKTSFLKSLEIARSLSQNTPDSSHALHGLGTVYEFLGKCAQARNDWQQAEQYGHQSIDAFEHALSIRAQLLGAHHLHVARSHHKLARNYAVLADLLNHLHTDAEKEKMLYGLADMHYQEALHIFEENNISPEQAKRKELTDEYQTFKKNLSSPADVN